MAELDTTQQWADLRYHTSQGSGDWFSEALGPLLQETIDSPLESLTPFTSINRLCFDASGRFPFESLEPVFVAFHQDGTYLVVEASPYDDERIADLWENSFHASDPYLAVKAVERILGLSRDAVG